MNQNTDKSTEKSTKPNIKPKARFYVPMPLQKGQISLPTAVAHHVRVLRLRSGDTVTVFNGDGAAWLGELDFDAAGACAVNVHSQDETSRELPFYLTLCQGLIAPDKMDWVIEKAAELGVMAVQPIAAARSVTKLDAARATKRLLHWQAIAQAASEQCGRNRILQIMLPQTLPQYLAQASVVKNLLLHPVGGVSLQAWARAENSNASARYALWIGPEGGWDAAELQALEAAQAQRLTFGARVMRSETAGLAVAAALQAVWCG